MTMTPDVLTPRVLQCAGEVTRRVRFVAVSAALLGIALLSIGVLAVSRAHALLLFAVVLVVAASYLILSAFLFNYGDALAAAVREESSSAFAAAFAQLHRLMIALAVFAIAGTLVIVLQMLPLFLNGVQGGQYSTLRNMRAVARALERYAALHHSYPPSMSAPELFDALHLQGSKLSPEDGWKRELSYSAICAGNSCGSYRLISAGADGIFQSGAPGEAQDDLMYGNGLLLRGPGAEVGR